MYADQANMYRADKIGHNKQLRRDVEFILCGDAARTDVSMIAMAAEAQQAIADSLLDEQHKATIAERDVEATQQQLQINQLQRQLEQRNAELKALRGQHDDNDDEDDDDTPFETLTMQEEEEFKKIGSELFQLVIDHGRSKQTVTRAVRQALKNFNKQKKLLESGGAAQATAWQLAYALGAGKKSKKGRRMARQTPLIPSTRKRRKK